MFVNRTQPLRKHPNQTHLASQGCLDWNWYLRTSLTQVFKKTYKFIKLQKLTSRSMLIETSGVSCCAIKSGWSCQISMTEHKLKPKNEANTKLVSSSKYWNTGGDAKCHKSSRVCSSLPVAFDCYDFHHNSAVFPLGTSRFWSKAGRTQWPKPAAKIFSSGNRWEK